jgi:opacity protein-like surface antigen
MKKILVCSLLAILVAFTALAADATGKWSGTYSFETGTEGAAVVNLKQSGTTITGTAGPGEDQQWPIQNGKIAGNKLTAELKSPDDGTVYKLELVMDGDNMKGGLSATTPDGQSMKGKLELARVKQ